MKNSDKAQAWKTIEDRVISEISSYSEKKYRGETLSRPFHHFMNDLCEKEISRTEAHKGSINKKQVRFIKEVSGKLNASEEELKEMSRRMTRLYLKEITGTLNPRMIKVIGFLAPKVFNLVFVKKSLWRLILNAFFGASIKPFFQISGNHNIVRKLGEKGTLIVAPTHSSNLDSPLLGIAFLKLGLPPLIYGAGLNLFVYRFFAFFMNRLGAYKVDRLKKNELYKMVLKEYCTYTLEAGYHNLFFPGGTRARSGSIESKIKVGLLGSGLEAYRNNVENGRPDKKIFIIPCTLNYHAVLEAPTLIEDHLKQEHQKRLVIADDESGRPNEIYYFLKSSSKFFLNLGDPIDPFGNRVREDGESIDDNGNVMDIAKLAAKITTQDENHNQTKIMAQKILDCYKRKNVILNSHVLAKAIYHLIRDAHPDQDEYELARTDIKCNTLDISFVYDRVQELVDKLRKMHQRKEIFCDEEIILRNINLVIEDGLRDLHHFHWPSAVRKHDNILTVSNFKLIIFYKNKLNGYGF